MTAAELPRDADGRRQRELEDMAKKEAESSFEKMFKEAVKRPPTPFWKTSRFNFIDGKELFSKPIPPISYLVDTLLCESSYILITGPPAGFKTGYMLYLAICGCSQQRCLGYVINKPLKTLFIDEENGLRRTKHKFNRLVRGLGMTGEEECLKNIMFSCISGFRLKSEWIVELIKVIKDLESRDMKPDLIVIDNISRCFVGSERDEEEVSKIQSLLKPVIEEYGVTFAIIHHCRKPKPSEKGRSLTLDDVRGSGDFGGQCDEAFILQYFSHRGEHTSIYKMEQLKIKDGELMEGINFSVNGNSEENTPLTLKFDGTIEEKVEAKCDKASADLLEWTKENPTEIYKTKEIIDAMKTLHDHGEHTVRKVLKSLAKEGLFRYKKGTYSRVGK